MEILKIATFLYFAYGSNLSTERIHINNPTAVRRDIAYLENYRLDFIGFSKRWKGSPATIVPTPNSQVWGAIWEINMTNLESLDRQEGVKNSFYFPMEIEVKNSKGEILKCRVYQQCNNPTENISLSKLPAERQPSFNYMKTIIEGARESQLPEEYINFLTTIKVRDNPEDNNH